MTDPTAPDVDPMPNALEAAEQHPTPPWGDDFTPEVAWEKIQKANREAANLRQLAKQPRLTAEQQQQLADYNRLVEASKTDAERLQEKAEAAVRDAESARTEAVRYKAAATHGISADHFDLLGSGTEEEITARAEKLAALIAAQSQPPAPSAPLRRPVEQLRPGATPAGAESEQDVIYAQLFGK